MRGVFVLFLAMFAGLAMLPTLIGRDSESPLAALESVQSVGVTVSQTIAWAGFILLLLASLANTGGAICEERRAGTLATLLTTPLSAWQITLGKLCAAIIQLGILGLSAVPVLLAIRVFGGVEAQRILATVAIIAAAALATCAIGLACSATSRSVGSAMGKGIALLFLWMLGVPLAVSIAGAYYNLAPNWLAVAVATPGFALAAVQINSDPGMPGWIDSPLLITAGCCAVSLVIALLALIVCSVQVRRVMRMEAAGTGGPTTTSRAARKAASKAASKAARNASPNGAPASAVPPELPAGAASPAPAAPPAAALAATRTRASREVSDQPIAWREARRAGRGVRQGRAARIAPFAICAASFIGLSVASLRYDWEPALMVYGVGLFVAWVLVMISAPGALTSEREGRTWESLLTTPLTAAEIVYGKFFGRLRAQVWIAVIVPLFVGVLALFESRDGLALATHTFLLLVPVAALLTASGLLVGLLFKRSTSAALVQVVAIGAIFIVLPMVVGMVAAVFNAEEELLQVAALAHPVAWLMVAGDGASDRWGAPEYDLVDIADLSLAQFTIALAFYSVAVCVATWLVLGVAVRVLRRRGLRESAPSVGLIEADAIPGR
jgi:ABC-type transport system involved in multi-copper enzyme maturation permease subunit